MQSLHTKLRQPASRMNLCSLMQRFMTVGLLVGVALPASLAIASPTLTRLLEFDRGALLRGELWRLVTGHLTHWNLEHLFWDLATFLVLAIVSLRRSIRNTLTCLLSGALAISLSILAWQPEIVCYRGLSGIDSALFALLAVCQLKDSYQERDLLVFRITLVALAGFLAKTGYELFTSQTLFVDCSEAGFVPLALAHAVGGLVGAVTAAFQDHAGYPATSIDLGNHCRGSCPNKRINTANSSRCSSASS